MITISDYLDEKLILFLNATSRDAALTALVDQAYAEGRIPDKDAFYQAIIEREKLVSTGIGMGVAIPHAKMAGYDEFFIAIAVLQKGVNWQSLDNAPVRIIFLIGGPDDKQTEYLQILSTLTVLIKNEELRKKMLTLNSQEAIIRLFQTAEG